MDSLNGGYPSAQISTSSLNHPFFDEWTTMAVSEASRRLSRGPSAQRAGSAMRITKPASTSNSPRASMMSSRRRTMVNDNHTYGRPQHDQQVSLTLDTTKQSARPVSWHPSSYMYTPQALFQQQQACYPYSTPTMYTDHQDPYSYPQLSPMMTSYSNNVSPCSAFSPLPVGVPADATPQYLTLDGWDAPQRSTPYFQSADGSNQAYPDMPPSLTHVPSLDTPAPNSHDWNSYMMSGSNNTTPPTPDSFVQSEQSQPAVSEDSVPFESLDENEEEGEILVGMGLYDTPDKYEEDPQLDHYRSTVSSLLGSTYRASEPTGKGLTLEEAWEPPNSDDEEGEEEEEEEDASAVATTA